MRDCVILINDRLVSLTHNSLLLIQPPTCPQSRSSTCVRVLVRVFGAVGTLEKVFLVCRLASEHLIVLVHDIKFQNFPNTPICLPTHISPGFCRRGNPMEVIDDCTVFFLGILPRSLMPTHKSSSPSSPFPLEHTLSSPKKKNRLKKKRLYLSF